MKRFLPDTSEPFRKYRANQERWLAAISDGLFRITEMLLVCGVVVYLEGRATVPPIASSILSGCVAIYARGRLSAAMSDAIEEENVSDTEKRRQHLIANALAACLFVAIITLTQPIVAVIVANQR